MQTRPIEITKCRVDAFIRAVVADLVSVYSLDVISHQVADDPAEEAAGSSKWEPKKSFSSAIIGTNGLFVPTKPSHPGKSPLIDF